MQACHCIAHRGVEEHWICFPLRSGCPGTTDVFAFISLLFQVFSLEWKTYQQKSLLSFFLCRRWTLMRCLMLHPLPEMLHGAHLLPAVVVLGFKCHKTPSLSGCQKIPALVGIYVGLLLAPWLSNHILHKQERKLYLRYKQLVAY